MRVRWFRRWWRLDEDRVGEGGKQVKKVERRLEVGDS